MSASAPMPRLMLLLALLPAPAAAEVVHSSAAGFTLRHQAEIAQPAGTVFDALLRVDRWWDADHTFSGDARNLRLEPKAGGCFCEKLDGGGSVLHMLVVHVKRGELLRLTGGLGPLQSLAVSGTMTFSLEEADGATRLTLTYQVSGQAPDGLESWAAPVDRVLGAQLERLGRYAATGSPAAG